jgi:hypothetical protein
MPPLSPEEAECVRKLDLYSRPGWRELTEDPESPRRRSLRRGSRDGETVVSGEGEVWAPAKLIAGDGEEVPMERCEVPRCEDARCRHQLLSKALEKLGHGMLTKGVTERVKDWQEWNHSHPLE